MSRDHRSTVELQIAMALALTKQWQRRHYGGIRPGVGRKMDVVVGLSQQLAGRLLFAVEVYREGEPVSDGEVELRIAEVLTSFPEGDAHVMAGRDIAAAEAVRERLIALIVGLVMTSYDVRVKEFTGLPAIAPSGRCMAASTPKSATRAG